MALNLDQLVEKKKQGTLTESDLNESGYTMEDITKAETQKEKPIKKSGKFSVPGSTPGGFRNT